MPLKPWYRVAVPREDLAQNRPVDASEFAVHLDQVLDGRAPDYYLRPEKFFERTYLTEGVKEMAGEALRRLAGETLGASPVINLTTQFGGGKTHALTLLYHLAKHGKAADKWPGVKDLLARAGLSSVPKADVAVFVGSEFDSQTGRGAPGEPLRKTPWGDIAWQLGGAEAFAVVAEHDANLRRPGKEAIRRFLPEDRPVLILMDEVLNYLNQARTFQVGGSTLAAQCIQFFQNLTEEATARRGISLVFSLPASELEMSPEDLADQSRLEKLSTRVNKPYILSQGDEIAEIIIRRLFDNRGPTADRRATANAYAEWLRDNRNSIPNWFPVDHAADIILSTYPFHPTVFSVFERKWQSLPKFQRTRGILRMLALWVARAYHDGYAQNRPDLLITLGTAPFEDSLFRSEVFDQLGEGRLEAAVMADLAGESANAVRLDAEAADTLKRARLHRKAASAVFFESSGGQSPTREYATLPEIRLAVGEPGLDIGNVETALEALVDGCYYLVQEGSHYRLSHKMGLNRLHADRMASVGQQKEKIEGRVREEVRAVFKEGPSLDRKYFPEASGEIPDRPALTLVVLAPDYAWEDLSRAATERFIENLIREYGQSGRTYKSGLLFAVAESAQRMRDQAKRLLAWEALDDEKEDLKLDESQQRQLTEQKRRAEKDLKEAVWNAYRHVVFLGKDGLRHIDLGLIHSSASTNGLPGLILRRLRDDGEIESEPSANFLARNWPVALTEWPTKAVRDAFFASPLFPRLTDPEVVRRTIASGVSDGLFGYAGKDAAGNYVGVRYKRPTTEAEVEISDSVVLLPRATAEALLSGSGAATIEYAQPQPHPIEAKDGGAAPTQPVVEIAAPTSQAGDRLRGLTWEGEVPPTKWMQFYTKVLSRFAVGGGLKLSVKVDIRPPEGVSGQRKAETEAALRELGLSDRVSVME
ncbi:MAG: DUF499 domain-containing protein [Anaerolineales bacterium]|nr:DUF499 domain-containing protein [Anaerolineales bacterium]